MTEPQRPESPKRRSNRLLVALVLLAVGGALVAKIWEVAVEPETSALDYLGAIPLERPAPAFELLDREGRPVRLEDFRGRWVFLNFWATWCESCRTEMPSMERLAQRLKGEDFAMLAATVDEGWAPVDAFFEEARPTFTVLHDPEAKWATAYGTTKFPETWLIGPDGRLRARFVGPRDWSDPAFEAWFASVLGRPAKAAGP